MATDRDVYVIDTAPAVDGLAKLTEAQEKAGESIDDTKKKSEGFGKQLEEFREDLFSHQKGYDALKTSLAAVGEFIKEGIKGYLEAEQAEMRLTNALRLAGDENGRYTAALMRQANAFEALTGQQAESVNEIQALLAQMGVAPREIERMTEASLRLANATGKDAKQAAQLLARAMAEGKDELKKYNIEVDEADFKARGFAAVLDQVEKKFVPLKDTIPESVRNMHSLKMAWDDFSEAIGGAIVRIASIPAISNTAKEALQGLTFLLNREDEKKKLEEYQALTRHSTALVDEYVVAVEEGKRLQNEYAAAMQHGGTQAEILNRALEDQRIRIRAIAQEQNKLGTGTTLGENPLDQETNFSDDEGETFDGGEIKKQREAALKARQAQKEEYDKLFIMSASNLARDELKVEEEKNARVRASISAQGDWELQNANYINDERRALDQAAFDHFVLMNEKEDAELLKKREKWKLTFESIKQDMQSWGQQMLSGVGNYIAGMITENTRFNQEMFALQVERETNGMSEADADKKRAQMEKQLQKDRAAGFLKMTADMLAQIAVQAGIKALFEGVEAIAAAARYDYAGAAQHGIAAAAYAGVAIAAGGTAALISATRPMTADEQRQLDAAKKDQTVGTDKQRSNDGPTRADAQAQTNVYYLGITGMTELQQSQELDRINRQYSNLATGAA